MNYGSIGNDNASKETTRLLHDSLALSLNNEEIGVGISDRLRMQREMLQGTKTMLTSLGTISESAAGQIRQIELRNWRKRCCLWTTIIILFLSNVFILCVMWRNGGKIFPSLVH
jgi:hypothetical protein